MNEEMSCILYEFERCSVARISRKSVSDEDWWKWPEEWAARHRAGKIVSISSTELSVDAGIVIEEEKQAMSTNPATIKQQLPAGTGPDVADLVSADIQNRAETGKLKYGERLKPHNGRNALWDAYQEALDLAMYLRQAIEEQAVYTEEDRHL